MITEDELIDACYLIGECWIWQLGKSGPYGKCRFRGSSQYAHRVAYQIMVGHIPDKLCVCHTCDNPLCMNPDHLFLGTQLDNIADRERKGRGRRGKLSVEQVQFIRNSSLPRKTLAEVVGLSIESIKSIRAGRCYAKGEYKIAPTITKNSKIMLAK